MKLFLSDWQIAYRLKKDGDIFSDLNTPFIPLLNGKDAFADPFLFNYNGKKYLFAEVMVNKKTPGKIGFCEWNGNGFDDWHIVLEEPYHLSYPNIFEYKDNVYIVPESNESNAVYVYKAIDFPNKWEKCKIIINNKKMVDTTFLEYKDKCYLFSYDIEDQSNKKLLLYEIDAKGNVNLGINNQISTDDSLARPAGNFIKHNNKYIRVSQNCKNNYGEGLVFSEVLRCSIDQYEEKEVAMICYKDINLKENYRITGLHTYNCDDELEVVDIHIKDYSITRLLNRIVQKMNYE